MRDKKIRLEANRHGWTGYLGGAGGSSMLNEYAPTFHLPGPFLPDDERLASRFGGTILARLPRQNQFPVSGVGSQVAGLGDYH